MRYCDTLFPLSSGAPMTYPAVKLNVDRVMNKLTLGTDEV